MAVDRIVKLQRADLRSLSTYIKKKLYLIQRNIIVIIFCFIFKAYVVAYYK